MSGIEWTGKTWNPTVGCSVTSPGCRECYAMKMAYRIEHMGGPAALKYRGTTEKVKGNAVWTGVVRLDPAALDAPLTWRTRELVFVNSMSDLFHEALEWSAIDRVFAIMALARRHTFQVLTKRPDRMRDYLADPTTERRVRLQAELIRRRARIGEWPLKHVWLGTSVEDQKRADERIPILLEVRAAVRFLSIEPLLGPVSLARAVGLEAAPPVDWVIVGGESGSDARPMHPGWARALRDECQQAQIPFFFKQFGQWSSVKPKTRRLTISLMPDGRDVAPSTPGSLTLWNVGKKAAGKVLDGRQWQEIPRAWVPTRQKAPNTGRGSKVKRSRCPGEVSSMQHDLG
jgi:protein gp37